MSPVLLNPPVNLTVQNGSDSNLWFYWNQTGEGCVESEVRFKTNNNKWEVVNKKIHLVFYFCWGLCAFFFIISFIVFASKSVVFLPPCFFSQTSKLAIGRQNFVINLPSIDSRYEVQVRSKLGNNCGESRFWSNWSEPVVWGSNNSTGKHTQ